MKNMVIYLKFLMPPFSFICLLPLLLQDDSTSLDLLDIEIFLYLLKYLDIERVTIPVIIKYLERSFFSKRKVASAPHFYGAMATIACSISGPDDGHPKLHFMATMDATKATLLGFCGPSVSLALPSRLMV